ncbi:hypothetical protein HanOQP8_Chr04g0152551 [Helianthus annuus]|nr:hypothetical protein HanOQP8_Chr04g0152551 [Helianthus annuus]
MGTIKKKPDEELWYHRIVKNFVLPRDGICLLSLLLVLSNLGIGPEKKKRATTDNVALKKSDVEKIQPSKVKITGGEKKGTRRSSDSWCDYVVVSDSLEGLTPVVTVRRPKTEPRDSTDIPPSNPNEPIDLESSPEHLVPRKAGKRKQTDSDAEGPSLKRIQKKKITRKGNLDAFISEPAPKVPVSHVPTEPQPVVNEELPPSPPRASIADQLNTTEVPEGGAEKTIEAEEPIDATAEVGQEVDPGVVDGACNP